MFQDHSSGVFNWADLTAARPLVKHRIFYRTQNILYILFYLVRIHSILRVRLLYNQLTNNQVIYDQLMNSMLIYSRLMYGLLKTVLPLWRPLPFAPLARLVIYVFKYNLTYPSQPPTTTYLLYKVLMTFYKCIAKGLESTEYKKHFTQWFYSFGLWGAHY